MAKTIATIMGVAFLLVGLIGFVSPAFLGTHLSMTHNLIHLGSGAVSLYFGLAGTLAGARLFDLVFGAFYGLLGVAGFLFGGAGPSTLGGPADMGNDGNLMKVIPGAFEIGTMDHTVHILIGLVYLIGGLLTRGDLRVDRR
jgi:hypothetical protein